MLLIFVSVACSSKEEASSSTNGDNQVDGNGEVVERTVIDYWHTYGEQEERVLYNEIKPLFEEEFPQYELKLTRMPFEGLKQQVITAVAGSATPDLMRMDIVWTAEFAEMGALVDVSTLDGFEEVKEQLFEAPMSTNFYDGGYYGLPLNTNTKIAVYNEKLLNEAGFTEPPATMEELEEAARASVAAGSMGGIGILGLGQTWEWLPYFWSLGGTLTNDDFTQYEGYLNSEASVNALETILSWHEEGLVTPTILNGQPGFWEGIERDHYMMINDGPWYFSILGSDQARPDPLDYTVFGLIPEGPAGSISPIGGENISIFQSAKNKEGAWEFLKWMTSEEPQAIMAKGTGLIPTNMEAAQDAEFLQIPYVPYYVEQLQTALPRTPTPKWSEIEEHLSLNIEMVFRGEMDLREALDDAAAKADEYLSK